jgi:uncharacterized protein YdcH (DUF465 family)
MTDYLNDYQKLMVEVRTELHHRPDLHDKVKGYIEELEQQKKNSQDQYIETFKRLEETDYQFTTLVKTHENLGDTLKLLTVENKALKEVVRAHGQLAAVMLSE